MREIILISFLGPDQPNQFTRLMQVLSVHSLQILDVGQAVIHNQLTLGIVVSSNDQTATALAMKDILILAHDIGLTVRFKPISGTEYDQWVSEGGRTRYIVTALAPELTAAHLQAVTNIVSSQGFNIETVTRLSGRPERDGHQDILKRSCVQFGLSGQMLDAQAMRAACLRLSAELNIDVAVQEDNAYRRNRRLVCFDMDSTLIEQEVIDELAKEAGVGDKVAEITELAMQGELDFQQSFRARVALLKGLDAEVLPKIAARLTITEGAERLISTLKSLGYKTAILSGGFQYFAEYLQEKLGIDEVHANILDVENGQVTGEVKGHIVDGARKAYLLTELAEKMGISPEQAIAVGDGANDLPMLSIAGLGVAFRAKPLVRQNANQAISSVGLDGVLYLLGVHDKDLTRA
ncbi:phosphoserine phosphatase SerB [Acinetobacter bereziniae]|uniref:Phosphoserine phosphatase n=1 Tax=Acinetobacter bereziniae LMG 1003 = CIP 70.12 TaxID=981324 RepID=N9E950_ACIBZ|nr:MULTISPECIES: phosphoserine phosphatase SerB [Acinetobacter]ATZ65575.1 phosphoserine phosphatase SerB [Acinetobacter bereziniae]ENV89380.1 phosphoserine phosphatase SerB [Acinetobacter bereziniae LMG 1003 = CIP 70.12]MBJ9372454.1 phosphoserine phosphatase SerB [Acinetobacter sp. TGL-Y2]MBJ9906888.1 phosphoserine phosphatase SerB [Acinetobacter bereziniae]MBJ9928390.1 phosphoserine phosphatase SerB [Acinetobacter bereziniae]